MDDDDDYREGSLWRHKTKKHLVKVKGTNADTVWFVYDSEDKNLKAYTTSKPLFEMFYEKVDPSDEGLYYLSKV